MKKRLLQLVVLLYTTIFLTTSVIATNGGINVGPYYDQFPLVSAALGPGSWVYALGCPADVARIETAYSSTSNLNLMIRAYLKAGDVGTKEQAVQLARDWAQALRALNTPNIVYFVPANEINNPVEGFAERSTGRFNETAFENLQTYLTTLSQEIADIRGTKIILLSPTVDPGFLSDTAGTQRPFMQQIAWDSYDGTAVSMYGEYAGLSLNTAAHPVKQGDYSQLPLLGVSITKGLYIVETGVRNTSDPGVLYAENTPQIIDYLSARTPNWNNVVQSAIIFSYNPDQGGDRKPWIYNATGVLNALKSKGAGPPVRPTGVGPVGNFDGLKGCVSESETPIFTDKGDQNERVELTIRQTKLYNSAAALSGLAQLFYGDANYFVDQVSAAIASIRPNGPGVLPDFILEKDVLGAELPKFLPYNFQVLTKKEELPSPEKIGIKLDTELAPASIRASVYTVEQQLNTSGTTNQLVETPQVIDGTTVAQPATNVEWAKPLRSLNKVYNSFTGTGEIIPSGNMANLREPPQILVPGTVPNQSNTGELVQTIQTATAGEIQFSENNIDLLVRILADLSPDPSTEQITANAETGFGLVSQTYISDFTLPEHKIDGKNYINSRIPYQVLPDYSRNARMENAYSTGGDVNGLNTIPLIANEAKGIEDGYNKVFCSSLPYKSPEWHKHCSENLTPNTSDWAINGETNPLSLPVTVPLDTTPIGAAMTQASRGKAPACVLQAVNYIENPNWTPTTSCTINACSAAGPFQITTGIDGQGNTTCPRCGSLGYCPDAWPNQWPINSSQPSPCDVNYAATVAIDLYKSKASYWTARNLGSEQTLSENASIESQKNAIILGGDSYYGSSVSIPRLGGCSYGEFVYKHCTGGSYQCGGIRPRL